MRHAHQQTDPDIFFTRAVIGRRTLRTDVSRTVTDGSGAMEAGAVS